MSLVIDTGVIVAAACPDEAEHAACRALLADTQERRVVPAPVIVEVEYFLRGDPAVQALLDDIVAGGLSVERLHVPDYERIAELLRDYADLRVGFVDCAVLAVVERLGETRLATLDHRHFTVMRPRHCSSLQLLPEAVATRIGTSQPAVARLESRAADPRLGTVERYLAAVGATLVVVPQAAQSSLAEVGEGVMAALRRDDPDEALRHVVQVIDDLYRASPDAVAAAVRDEPAPTGSLRWDAMLAGVGEYVCRRTRVRVPGWMAAPSRFLDEFWFVVGDVLGHVPAGLACVALVESPPELANRGVFLDQTTLVSV